MFQFRYVKVLLFQFRYTLGPVLFPELQIRYVRVVYTYENFQKPKTKKITFTSQNMYTYKKGAGAVLNRS